MSIGRVDVVDQCQLRGVCVAHSFVSVQSKTTVWLSPVTDCCISLSLVLVCPLDDDDDDCFKCALA